MLPSVFQVVIHLNCVECFQPQAFLSVSQGFQTTLCPSLDQYSLFTIVFRLPFSTPFVKKTAHSMPQFLLVYNARTNHYMPSVLSDWQNE
ncbi:hypothetical protein DFP93_104125 [Aneurinibacillus soli]|uniref:Uncharacterized protein n=1 Tax=Aneurinibacillus soli TaxID=1500254 RepID=A0A0U5ATF7_9BACL|nr:hypothetical protein DFP93_104125 [Aneurinibacillus soli]BAU27041.1 hypothetical protein CB4_01210 [Aneurinibacillus soli]